MQRQANSTQTTLEWSLWFCTVTGKILSPFNLEYKKTNSLVVLYHFNLFSLNIKHNIQDKIRQNSSKIIPQTKRKLINNISRTKGHCHYACRKNNRIISKQRSTKTAKKSAHIPNTIKSSSFNLKHKKTNYLLIYFLPTLFHYFPSIQT